MNVNKSVELKNNLNYMLNKKYEILNIYKHNLSYFQQKFNQNKKIVLKTIKYPKKLRYLQNKLPQCPQSTIFQTKLRQIGQVIISKVDLSTFVNNKSNEINNDNINDEMKYDFDNIDKDANNFDNNYNFNDINENNNIIKELVKEEISFKKYNHIAYDENNENEDIIDNDDEERYGYHKCRSDYIFNHI